MELIMIVDNSSLDSFIAQTVINQVDNNIDSVILPSAFSALDYLKESYKNNNDYPWPSIILLEMDMPVINGYNFLDKFKHFPPYRRDMTAIFSVSKSNHSLMLYDYLTKGIVAGFIHKPFKINDLKYIISKSRFNKIYEHELFNS